MRFSPGQPDFVGASQMTVSIGQYLRSCKWPRFVGSGVHVGV